MIFEKFGESATRKITTYVKCHLKLPPLLSLSWGSGSVTIPNIRPPFYLSPGSIPETPDLIADLNNLVMMRQPIQQRSRHLLIIKLRRLFPKGQIAYSDLSEHRFWPKVNAHSDSKWTVESVNFRMGFPTYVQLILYPLNSFQVKFFNSISDLQWCTKIFYGLLVSMLLLGEALLVINGLFTTHSLIGIFLQTGKCAFDPELRPSSAFAHRFPFERGVSIKIRLSDNWNFKQRFGE